jgi:hypothetical protein
VRDSGSISFAAIIVTSRTACTIYS